MMQDTNQVIKIAQEIADNIIAIENELTSIYTTFPFRSYDEKIADLKLYEELISEKHMYEKELQKVKSFLRGVISDLDKIEANWIDKMSYKKKIDVMRNMIKSSITIRREDMVPENAAEIAATQSELPVIEDVEIKADSKKKK